MRRSCVFLFCAVIICSLSIHAIAVPDYTIEIIGTNMDAWAVNDSGQVVIYPYDGHTYIWDKGQVTDVGRIGTAAVFTQDFNNAGQVVGFYDDGSGEHAFAGVNGTIQDLNVNPTGSSTAMCINNNGAIAGIRTIDGRQQGFFMQDELSTLSRGFREQSGLMQ